MDKEKKVEKVMMGKEALKAMQELEESVKLENIVKDNKIEFKSGDNFFRVRKPTLEEQTEIDTARRKKLNVFMDDDSYFFKKQWIEKYKKKGINIDKMETDIKRIEDEIKKTLIRLAKTTEPKVIGNLKDEILKLRDKQYALSIEKTDLLSYSIEDQTFIYTKCYTACLILERKEKDSWVKYFKNFDEFEKSDDSDLIGQLLYYYDYLIYSEIK